MLYILLDTYSCCNQWQKNQFSTEQLPTNFDIKSAGYIAYLQVQDPRNMSRLCSLFEYTWLSLLLAIINDDASFATFNSKANELL